MRKQTWVQTLAWTAGTCALTLTLLGTSSLQAEDPQNSPVAELHYSAYTDASGAVVHLAFADKDAKPEAGKALPAMNLVATGAKDKDVTLKVTCMVSDMRIPSPMSRSLPEFDDATSGEQELVIKAGQTVTVPIKLKADVDLKSGYSYRMTLSTAGGHAVALIEPAMSFDLVDPKMNRFMLQTQSAQADNAINRVRNVNTVNAINVPMPTNAPGTYGPPMPATSAESNQVTAVASRVEKTHQAGPTTSIVAPLPPETQPATLPAPNAPAKGASAAADLITPSNDSQVTAVALRMDMPKASPTTRIYIPPTDTQPATQPAPKAPAKGASAAAVPTVSDRG